MGHSDHDITRGVRSVLTRHWVDMTKTNFLSRRGILRMMGELRRLGAEASTPIQPRVLDTLDQELKRVGGIRRVHYDLTNWRRGEGGEWRPVVSASDRRNSRESEENSSELDQTDSVDDE